MEFIRLADIILEIGGKMRKNKEKIVKSNKILAFI